MTTLYLDNHYITTLNDLKHIIKTTDNPASMKGRQLLSAVCDGVVYRWLKESSVDEEQQKASDFSPERFLVMSGDTERLNTLRSIFDIVCSNTKQYYDIEIVSKPNRDNLMMVHSKDTYHEKTIPLEFGIKCTEVLDEKVKLRILNVEHTLDFNKQGVQTIIFELPWQEFKAAKNIKLTIGTSDKRYWECDLLDHEWVDLGLSVKWATCNIGANKPEEYGNYFAWGETYTKEDYSEDTSDTYDVEMEDISGNNDYDAARDNWGGTWRLPTKREMEELENKCSWKWTTQSGMNGYKVTGPNGNSIFLPAAGYCYGSSRVYVGESGFYWSSTPYERGDYGAYDLYFGSGYHVVGWNYRVRGRLVRPVSE